MLSRSTLSCSICDHAQSDRRTPMHYMVAHLIPGGRLKWEHMAMGGQEPTGVTITFPMYHQASLHQAQRELATRLSAEHVEWLRPSSQGLWLFRSDVFNSQFPELSGDSWLRGDILIPMDHDVENIRDQDFTYCQFVITPEVIEEQMPKKVFLSHSGPDKP